MSAIVSRVPRALLSAVLAAACGGSETGTSTRSQSEGADLSVADGRSGPRRSAAPDVGEDDDALVVEGLKGHLSPYAIKTGIRRHRRSLARCYQRHAGDRAYIGGHVEFDFVVGTDGGVRAVKAMRSELGTWAVESCLLGVVREMTFSPPDGGEAEVNLPLDFDARRPAAAWAGTRAKRELSAPPSRAPRVIDASPRQIARERKKRKRRRRALRRARARGLDAGVLEARTKREALARCEDQADSAPPKNASITVYVGRRGRVTSAGFSAVGAIDEAWAECAVATMTAWRMSAPTAQVAKLSFPYPPPT